MNKKYAAKILFQFRFEEESTQPFRMVEERIIHVNAPSAKKAYSLVSRRGKKAQHQIRNDDGSIVHFEFIGILDLMHLGLECAPDEVWYSIKKMKAPMERKADLIPLPNDLPVMRLK